MQLAEGMYAARKARKTMTSFRTLLDTTAPDATILVGAVFLSEGIQKFLFSVTSYGFWRRPMKRERISACSWAARFS